MQSCIIKLKDEAASIDFAQYLSKKCQPPLIIFLQGEIGAGKTTIVRALLRALGVQGPIKSPTFTLIETYSINHWQFCHVDLYRLSAAEELEYLGLRDLLDPNTICFIEWPQRAIGYLPIADLTCYLSVIEQGRELKITPGTEKGKLILAGLRI